MVSNTNENVETTTDTETSTQTNNNATNTVAKKKYKTYDERFLADTGSGGASAVVYYTEKLAPGSSNWPNEISLYANSDCTEYIDLEELKRTFEEGLIKIKMQLDTPEGFETLAYVIPSSYSHFTNGTQIDVILGGSFSSTKFLDFVPALEDGDNQEDQGGGGSVTPGPGTVI